MRKTKIICTIGPATESVEMLVKLIEAGMNVARLNFSHGSHEEHGARIVNIREASRRTGKDIAILQDLKGPEIRLGLFEGGKVMLEQGKPFTLVTEECLGTAERAYVQHPGLVNDVRPGDTILMDDGNLNVLVNEVTATEVRCTVVVGGPLSNRKKCNLPGKPVSLPALAERDAADIRFAVEQGMDIVAGSFIRKAQDVLEIRKIIESAGGDQLIISKIESQEGYDNLEEILQVSDGLMVARGDLGVEVPAEEVPIMQKRMIERCNFLGKPVITATQMLESMITKPVPTRAEASDVANAIFDGTDCIMLSAETASGSYPINAVNTMDRVACRTEQSLDYVGILNRKRRLAGALSNVTDAISHATVTTAADLEARAIITATASGFTARNVSKYRPQAQIIAVTPSAKAARRLNGLNWGVQAVVREEMENTDALIERSVEAAVSTGLVQDGELVVITAGVPVGIQGTTNLIKVHMVGEVLASGTGIGRRLVAGAARVVRTAADAERVAPGEIVVVLSAESDVMSALERAAGIVAEEGGLTSQAAVVGLSLGIPVVVGASGATERITDGQLITVDTIHGLVYRGQARAR